MVTESYDIVTVGGGLGGAALAGAMARNGYRVLVLERETSFKDRVRGEQMSSWGAAEAKELGLYDLLVENGAHELIGFDIYMMGNLAAPRDVRVTTPSGLPNLTFFHPEAQEALLRDAARAGATVRRGARVRSVTSGKEPSVSYEVDGTEAKASARLVAGADGRGSMVRKWAGFREQNDPDRLFIAGVWYHDMPIDPDRGQLHVNFMTGVIAPLFPQGDGRVRSYVVVRVEHGRRFQGEKDLEAYAEHCAQAGAPADAYEAGRAVGPLATFSGADSWVDHPYKDSVALIGDAAATSDPSWGQGLSLTMRDARMLRDALLADEDWERAGHAYAEAHDACYGAVHETEALFTQLFHDVGPEGDARRMAALPKLAQEPDRMVDTFQSGPDAVVLDEAARRRMFGED